MSPLEQIQAQAIADSSVGAQIPAPEVQLRRHYIVKCIATLQEADSIRKNDNLMKEIRAFIRQQRDEAADLLDKIGGS